MRLTTPVNVFGPCSPALLAESFVELSCDVEVEQGPVYVLANLAKTVTHMSSEGCSYSRMLELRETRIELATLGL